MTRSNKRMVVCEVCPEPIGHGRTVQVGKKANNYPRLIHDRSACRARWKRDCERIMAKWPEVREERERELREAARERSEQRITEGVSALVAARRTRSNGVVMGVHNRAFGHSAVRDVREAEPRPGAVEQMVQQAREAAIVVHASPEGVDATEVPTVTTTKQEVDTMNANTQAKGSGVKGVITHRILWRAETDKAILDYYAGQPFARGSGIRCMDYIRRTAPELFTERDGTPIGEGAFGQHIKRVLAGRVPTLVPMPAPTPSATAAQIESERQVLDAEVRAASEERRKLHDMNEQARTRASAATTANELCIMAWTLAARMAVDTLKTLESIAREEVTRIEGGGKS